MPLSKARAVTRSCGSFSAFISTCPIAIVPLLVLFPVRRHRQNLSLRHRFLNFNFDSFFFFFSSLSDQHLVAIDKKSEGQ